ncbi:hypothetical protein LHP98_01135 [Rhodobacter sp. Har01]|uniref:hypothetical protein n=1 Tax=Rhodobacter sp. Har01 TaxID=2883999 RepID=UPI001D06CCC4|nr:hypothetical protein [Rhodobacter sp. Har01]MCB6176731.1 hypothetical protein [Rhodobacter sp. Har01]
MRLCVIGNSHLAALKLGWDALSRAGDPAWAKVTPVFFGAPRDGMRQVRLDDGCIVPARKDIGEQFALMSGGQTRIRLGDYDGFVLVGLNVSIKRILRLYRTHLWYGLADDPRKTLLHSGVATDFLTERYGSTLLVQTAALLRGAVSAPIVALAEPFWASWVRAERDAKPDYGWDKAISAGDAAALAGMFRSTVTAALAPHASFVPQPPQTVEDGILTAAPYNKDASRLISGDGGGTDAAHMNGAFGAALWPLLRQALQSETSVAAA